MDGKRRGAGRLGSVNVRALIGSGCLWSWVDALYMSSFFLSFDCQGAMPEFAAWAVSLLGVPICLLLLKFGTAVRRLLARRRALVAIGAIGTAASLLFVLAAWLGSWPLLVAGSVLGAGFMSAAILAWGGVYCAQGARSAALYVAGGFACALVIDLLSLLLTLPAPAFAFALLPVASCGLLARIDAGERSYAPIEALRQPLRSEQRRRTGLAGLVRRSLGIAPLTMCSLILIMLGFGYMQHQISFTALPGLVLDSGVSIQIMRGVVAVVLFVVIVAFPRRASAVYRIGLLAIVAGFSLMPFLSGGDELWVSGTVIMAGYTTFDVLIWIVVAQVACARLADPLKVVGTMRILINGTFCSLGAFIAIGLSFTADAWRFAYADAIFVGYLMTVAVVLVLSSRDVWDLFDARPPAPDAPDAAASLDARIASLAQHHGLTDREREVFALLAMGRTQPWIAESLGISESTVNSHVRHIYGKFAINSRQELLDLVVCAQSPESVDTPS